MAVLKNIVLLTAVTTIGIGYLLYTPIPSGFSQPWKTHLACSIVNLVKIVVSTWERLGLGSGLELGRSIVDSGSIGLITPADHDGLLQVSDSHFDGIPVRIYTPVGKPSVTPGFVFYHGGGWVVGSANLYDSFTRRLAKSLGIVVVSVEYRLAPEHIFPAAFDDCVTATKFFLRNAADFGVDATRVGIGGDSAGGNLAAAVSIKLRDDQFQPHVKLQILIYPIVQALDFSTPSYQQNGEGMMLPTIEMASHWTRYLQGRDENIGAVSRNEHVTGVVKEQMASSYMDVSKLPRDVLQRGAPYKEAQTGAGDVNLFNEIKTALLNPYACPLLEDDLSGLPKAYVFTCQHDVLRDEGIWYAQRLKEAGVDVTHRHADIAFHGILLFHNFVPEAIAYTEEIISYMKAHL